MEQPCPGRSASDIPSRRGRISVKQILRRLAAVLLTAAVLCGALPACAVGPGSLLTAAQVTVRFHASGSRSEAPAPIIVEGGERVTLPQTVLSSPFGAEGWYFTGWSEQSTSPTPQYLPGDSFSPVRDTNLYAIFSRTPPSFDPNTSFNTNTDPAAPPDQSGTESRVFTLKTGPHTSYMGGGSDGLFRPSQALSRAEAAQLLAGVITNYPTAYAAFSDISGQAWYAPAVSTAAGLGLLPGYSDGTFRPDQPITRGEAAYALAQLIPDRGQTRTFPDVPAGHRYYAAVCAVGGYGLFSGDEYGNFNPDASLQRAEAAVVFNKLTGRSPDPSAVYARSLRYFPDVPTTHWAYSQIMEATTTHSHTDYNGGETWSDIRVEPVPLADGFYRLNGGLYCVSGGQFLRSASKDCFTFDSEGRYTVSDAALDAQLNALVNRLTNNSMTRDQKLRALYNYCRDNFSYLKRPLVQAGATGWEPEYASAFLSMKKGNCYSFSSLFCLLAREIGQPAYTVVGGLGKKAAPHGWVELKLDGTVYMFDPQLEWRYVHDYGRGSHNLFKVLPNKAPHIYTKLSGGVP